MTAGVASLGSPGSKVRKIGCGHIARSLDKVMLYRQVGQESNLQPAVMEVAALRPVQSRCAGYPMLLCMYSPVSFHRIAAIFAATILLICLCGSQMIALTE